jgi:hypothetical protein
MRCWDEVESDLEHLRQDIILIREGLNKSVALLDHMLERLPKENQ